MTVTLMKNNSEKNRVVKDVQTLFTTTGYIRENTSIVSPTFTLQVAFNSVVNCNYVYVPDFKRYYYITDMVQVAGNLTQVFCRCDVLMSFSTEILSNTAVIARQENVYNRYLNDANFKTYQNSTTVTKRLSGAGFGEAGYILVTAGQSS